MSMQLNGWVRIPALAVGALVLTLALQGCFKEPSGSDGAISRDGLSPVIVARGDDTANREIARFERVYMTYAENPRDSRPLKHFRDAVARVRAAYVYPVADDRLIDAAIAGLVADVGDELRAPGDRLVAAALDAMTADLDPHSDYLDAEEMRDLEVVTTGEFGGMGIQVTMEEGKIKVIAPIEGTPADQAGLRAGDLITQVDSRDITGMSLSQAIQAMRGEPGSRVRLTVERPGRDAFEVTITRAIITVEPVRWATHGHVGYLRIIAFNERTADRVGDAMAAMQDKLDGRMRGLVMDLRSNPGGLFDQSYKVTDFFLDSGMIVAIRGRDASRAQVYRARHGDLAQGLPIVVLVDGGSASASEIVASALQENGRAMVMGTPSFGKGSVQMVIMLPDGGGLKLTTALYYSPSGHAIQARGVLPDVMLTGMDDIYENHRESAIPGALPAAGADDRRMQARIDVATCPAIDDDRQLGCALGVLDAGSLDHFLSSSRPASAG